MTKEMDFFIYLLEKYSEYKKSNAADVLKLWNEKNISDYIYDMYWVYHTEALENAYSDIDKKIAA